MATISAGMVKELRDKTGAGMMDCKKALEEAQGDMETAVDELRKRGQAIADKKGARATKEGLIFAKVEGGVGVLLEVNCETDFVARNEAFIEMGKALADKVHKGGIESVEALLASECPLHPGKTVNESLREAIAKIGENMAISRFVRIDSNVGEGKGFVHAYIHPPGKLGVLVELRTGKAETAAHAGLAQLAHDLSMHVAAAQPLSIHRESIGEDVVAREKAIYLDQTKMEGKPEKIWEKIVDGKLAKFFQQSVLMEQPFVRDPDQTIKALVEATAKQLGDTVHVARFERFVVGGGAEAEKAEEAKA